MARVALLFNLIRADMLRGVPLDAVAELDTEPTIRAVEAALREGGHEVIRVEADEDAYSRLRAGRVDLVFNIAEGLRGESRESHIPAMCELLGVPYTGSGVLTTALCLDKARTKEILLHHGLATPAYQVLHAADEPLTRPLRYPLIVKLLHEGSSMGLSAASVVDDGAALGRQVARLIATYGQPALVEEFIEGREFTVGVLGNADLTVLPIVEVTFGHRRGINLFQPDDAVLEMLAQERLPVPAAAAHGAVCPAAVDAVLGARIRETACRAYWALECRDWCRMEMRLGADDCLYVLELNPIAGIDPSYLLPRAAAAAGVSYTALVNRIVELALERNGKAP